MKWSDAEDRALISETLFWLLLAAALITLFATGWLKIGG